MDPLLVIAFCLLFAGIIGELFSHFKMPRVVGQIITGLILGLPFLRPLFFDQSSMLLLDYLANIGIVLFLFFAGLEINFRLFVQNIKIASGISFFNTIIPLALGFGASRFFGLSTPASLLVGICLSVSAAAIALDIVDELRILKTRLGGLIVTAGAVDDVYELILVTVAVAIIEASKTVFVRLLLNTFIFVIIILLFKAWIIPLILRFLEKRSSVTLFTSGLVITLLMAGLSQALGFGVLLGALISGVMIRQVLLSKANHHRPWEAHSISHTIHTIAFGFLVPLFFVNVGLQTDLRLVWDNLSFGILITIIAIFGTVFGSAIGYYLSKRNWHNGILLGWAMTAKGDTELAIATLALKNGIISQSIFSSLIFMAVVCTLVSPFVLRKIISKRK